MTAAVDARAGWDAWSATVLARTERTLDVLLPPEAEAPSVLHAGMRHAALDGGKRVRPLLVHAAGAVVRAPAAALDLAGAAVELVHAYSLVHDDLPCMDNDTLRRGKPTVWAKYGEAQAMLVGDGLQALAFEALARLGGSEGGVRPGGVVRMVSVLARAAGARGMVGGQALDLDAVGRAMALPDLEAMHRRKTGALLHAAVRLGAECGDPLSEDACARLDAYAAAIGLAFQVVDDILDVEGDTATLGKTAGKDSGADKPTYVSAMGLDGARALAARLRDDARDALAPFGGTALRLREIADLIVLRKN